MKKQEIKEMRRALRTTGTTLNIPTSDSQGCQKEKRKQETENLLEQITENFPNLAKEIDFQEVQQAQSPKEVRSKKAHTEAHHNYITQD